MSKVQAGVTYNAVSGGPLVLQGNDTVALWSGVETVTTATLWAGGNSITGGDGTYTLQLTGGHDTICVGNGNDTIAVGAPAPEPMDQQILVGGIQGFADLADASNTTSLMATGRVSEYLHWAALIDASTGKLQVPGAQATLAQIAQMKTVFAHSSGPLAELNYDANPQSYFSGLFTTDFTKLGFHPTNANVNMFELWRSAGGVATWDSYVNQARDTGLQTVAPIYSPNDVPGSFAWSDAQFDPIRAMALYGGAIGIDAPPSFFFAQNSGYQQFIQQEIKWGVAHGLRVSVIVSPYTGRTTYLADTQNFVQTLIAAGAVPTQWVAENYDVPVPADYPNRLGSEDQPNTVDNIALWLARNAPTAAQTQNGGNHVTVGNGRDRITLAVGDTLAAGSGIDTVSSAGSATISIGGGGGTLALGQQDSVTISSGAYGLTLGGTDSVTALTGSLTVHGGAAGGGADTVNLASGFASVFGVGAALSVNGGAGRLAVTLGAGGGFLQGGSAGGNVLAAGSGAATILGGGAGDTIDGGSGGVTIATAATGGAELVLGSGAAAVTLHAGDTLMGGSGAASLGTLNGDTVSFGSGSLAFAIGTGNLILAGGSQDRVISALAGNNTISGAGGTGNAQFTGGTGFDVLYAGSGSDVLTLGTGGGEAFAGLGNATLIGGAGAMTLTGGGGFTDFVALQGNATILGGSGTGVINLGGGVASVHLQSGHDTVNFGPGAATVYGGTGRDSYDLTNMAGSRDVLWGFKPGTDTLSLEGGATVASEQFTTGAVVLTLSDGAAILVYGNGLNAAHLPHVTS